MLEVLHISPKITAMGFFEVDLHLYRTVFYHLINKLLAIFRQFHVLFTADLIVVLPNIKLHKLTYRWNPIYQNTNPLIWLLFMFLQLIGTTAMYLIILCQFQTAGKNGLWIQTSMFLSWRAVALESILNVNFEKIIALFKKKIRILLGKKMKNTDVIIWRSSITIEKLKCFVHWPPDDSWENRNCH